MIKNFFLISIFSFFLMVTSVYAQVPEQVTSGWGEFSYCEPSDVCGWSIMTVPGKQVTIDIKVKDGIPALVKVTDWDDNAGIVTLEETIFYESFHGSYVPISDNINVDISSASEDNIGIEYDINYISYMYPQDKNRGGCLIATATYGSELAPQVQQLRELRDNSLLQTNSGSTFMSGFNQFYYSFSPTIADWERQNLVFKEAVKLTITPLITSLSILNYVDMDSEAEVLGYGISLILLNIGMYFVAPAIIIIKIRDKIDHL